MLYICKLSNKLDLNQAIHVSHRKERKGERELNAGDAKFEWHREATTFYCLPDFWHQFHFLRIWVHIHNISFYL